MGVNVLERPLAPNAAKILAGPLPRLVHQVRSRHGGSHRGAEATPHLQTED
jgi:hypothetical protein